ncbi:C25 family cysteine peptidase [uncultured Thiodictyon sp.]|uniref:C25 family cysteine peptidase n=1 Tax=uncultured Thiodictyon sp. TaxID=1846217 RepID=UPI0026002EC0|nr:C25 family cysteine peptidase [uncultured Thiodictyon sp.]
MISLGEALLLNPHGGAVAVWSSGGYSYDSSAATLNGAFLDAALGSGAERLGDAIQAALGNAAQSYGPAPAAAVYNLLGDPATLNRLH